MHPQPVAVQAERVVGIEVALSLIHILRKCWGKRAAVVTALPKNDLGWLVEDFIMQGGVDMSHVIWRDFDGLGRNTRVGLNFTEKGFGIRPALGCSDRGHSAASQIRPGEVNWEKLFGEEGVRWFQTGGIFAALASNTAEAVLEAVQVAKVMAAPGDSLAVDQAIIEFE